MRNLGLGWELWLSSSSVRLALPSEVRACCRQRQLPPAPAAADAISVATAMRTLWQALCLSAIASVGYDMPKCPLYVILCYVPRTRRDRRHPSVPDTQGLATASCTEST
jgi:hypothetical protein